MVKMDVGKRTCVCVGGGGGVWHVVEIGIEMNDFLTGGLGMQLTSRLQSVLGF